MQSPFSSTVIIFTFPSEGVAVLTTQPFSHMTWRSVTNFTLQARRCCYSTPTLSHMDNIILAFFIFLTNELPLISLSTVLFVTVTVLSISRHLCRCLWLAVNSASYRGGAGSGWVSVPWMPTLWTLWDTNPEAFSWESNTQETGRDPKQ